MRPRTPPVIGLVIGLVAGLVIVACDAPSDASQDKPAHVPNVAAISAGGAEPAAGPASPDADDAATPPTSAPLATDEAVAAALGLGPDDVLTVEPWRSGGGHVAFAQPSDLDTGRSAHLAVLDDDRRLRASAVLDLREVCPGDAERCQKAWLDLAPYRIADDEVAVGLRLRVFASAATGVGTDDKLLLYRITGDTLTPIARIHMASDWTRASENTVIIVTDREHNGLYDLRQRGKGEWSIGVGEAREDGEDEIRITWEFDGERYVIRSSVE